jgi:DNA-binding SARP family transcriptional activator
MPGVAPTVAGAADRALVDAIVAGVVALDPRAASDLREELHARLDGEGDPALMALLHAVDELAERWRQQHEQMSASWRAHAEALTAEGVTRRSLLTVLSTTGELLSRAEESTAGSTPASPPGPVPGSGFPRALERGPISSGAANAACRLPEGARTIELAACLLGPFVLFQRGRVIAGWRGTKTPRLVRYLLAQGGHPVHREQLIELFWPDADTETGRRCLHQAIYLIRRVLRGDDVAVQHIAYENEAYMINRAVGFWSDLEEFEKRVAAGHRAEQAGRQEDALHEYELAASVYGGDLLEDTPHEDWALTERDRLRLLCVEACNRQAELRLARGEPEAALHISQQVLRLAPSDEMAHRRAMRCYAEMGSRGLAAEQYRKCIDVLADSLELEPSPETTQLYVSLLREQAGGKR